MYNYPTLDLLNTNAYIQNLVKTHQFILKILRRNEILTSINPLICSREIKLKQYSNVNQRL